MRALDKGQIIICRLISVGVLDKGQIIICGDMWGLYYVGVKG